MPTIGTARKDFCRLGSAAEVFRVRTAGFTSAVRFAAFFRFARLGI
jgi:hypothetical protein